MTSPVDLDNLRSMTDGDVEMEKALFDEFYLAFEKGLKTLESNIITDSEAWRKESHALKGIAFNLGAMKLGELCKKGQEEHTADEPAKRALLGQLESEYALVKQFLLSV